MWSTAIAAAWLVTCAAASIVVPPTDHSIYYSTYNWAFYATPPVVRSSNNGAYLKFSFTGTSVALGTSSLNSAQNAFMNLLYSIDDGPLKEVAVPARVDANISLGSGLSSDTHSIIIYIYNSLQSADRWNVNATDNSAILTITGLVLDDRATVSPPPTLAPNSILTFGDSITEGVEAECQPGGDLFSNAGTKTWAMALAAALDSEVSVVGYGRLGWTVPGNGKVPPVFTPGSPAQSSWNQVLGGYERSFSPAPKAIFILHATNDGSVPDDPVTKSAFGWLQAIRSAAPTSHVFLTVPFGGFKRAALQAAYQQYQGSSPDPLTHFIDLGEAAARGTSKWRASAESCDGIHPYAYRHGQLGAMLAAAATKLMM